MTLQRRTPMKRTPFQRKAPKVITQEEARVLFGTNSLDESAKKKRVAYQAEAQYGAMFEELLQKHRLDFWHDVDPMHKAAGYPDYTIWGDGWHAWVELKARSPITNRRGKVAPEQHRFREAIEKSAGEWRTFCLPDDWDEVDAWLNGHTGKGIWGWGKAQALQGLAEALKKRGLR